MIKKIIITNTEKIKKERELKGFSYRDMSKLIFLN